MHRSTGAIYKKHNSTDNYKKQKYFQPDTSIQSVASTSRENIVHNQSKFKKNTSFVNSNNFKVPKIPGGAKRTISSSEQRPAKVSRTLDESEQVSQVMEIELETDKETKAAKAIINECEKNVKTIIVKEKVHVKDASTQAGNLVSKGTQTDWTGDIAQAEAAAVNSRRRW